MFELRVLSGLNFGAALPLFGESWLIGQADDADLQLNDEGVEAQHGRLQRENEHWILESIDGDLVDQQGRQVTRIDQLESGDAFAVGDVWLCVADADAPWAAFTPPEIEVASEPETEQQKTESGAKPAAKVAADKKDENQESDEEQPVAKRAFPRWMTALTLSLILLFSFTVVSWILQPTVAQTSVNQSSRKHLDTPDEVREPLLTMLRERELSGVVSVLADKRSVTLKGSLNKDQMLVFNRMLGRFNTEYMTGLPVINEVESLNLELPFKIVQITTGARANIVTDSGRRMFIGDQVGGLRLVSINSNRVEFAGNNNIRVSW